LCPLFIFAKSVHCLERRHDQGVTKITTIEPEPKMKIAILILSDPKVGEEALGRAFNALALAAESIKQGDETEIVFTGTGTRWPAEPSKPTHPAYGLYQSVLPSVVGACNHCAIVFGAEVAVNSCGLSIIKDNELAGTQGLASIRRYLAEGWQTLLF
jgi:hypothetical protein